MAAKKHTANQPRHPPARESTGNLPQTDHPISKRRRWLFRFLALVLGPLLVLGGLEACLRLVGYGYPTRFFLQENIQGKEYLVPNDRFGYRFFPPALARTPVAQRLAVKKSTKTFRIFLFGESAALGDPEPSFGVGRYLQALLSERYPGTDFEVVCAAMTGINSHVLLPVARECEHLDGDLWLVYMGNNEMVGPFGAGTIFGSRAPSAFWVRTLLALKTTRTGQWLEHLARRWAPATTAPKAWGGLEMFKEHQLASDSPSRLRAYRNFEANLRDILRAGHQAGVPIILSTVAANLKDCPPFASLQTDPLPPGSQKSEWAGIFRAGLDLEAAGDFGAALKPFSQAAAIAPRYAEVQFHLGNCELALTNTARALRAFELARDEDALAFRADDRINRSIRAAAQAHSKEGVFFVDAAAMLARSSKDGIPGKEWFYDHVHFNFTGNYWLALAFAEQAATLLPESITARGQKQWATSERCERRLAVSPWARYSVWLQNFSRVAESPFREQSNQAERARYYMSVLDGLKPQMNEAASAQSRAMFQEALALAPNDHFLHNNFAEFLSAVGDFPEALNQERKVSELLPHNPLAPYKMGLLSVTMGNIRQAQENFSRALALEYMPALNELGLILAHQHKLSEAASCFARVLRTNPGSVEAYLGWGFVEQIDGKWEQALAHYQQAAELQPSGPATAFYQGVVSARKQERDAAINYFQAAAFMKPTFWQALYLLGMELAAKNKLPEAEGVFSQVVLIRPDFAKAHLNYGVALARQGKLEEARKQFQAAVSLNPEDRIAQQNLEAVQTQLTKMLKH